MVIIDRVRHLNTNLESAGLVGANFIVRLTVVLLMLAPGIIFIYFFYSILLFVTTGEWSLTAMNLVQFVVTGIISWYLGLGLNKLEIKDV